MADAPVRRGKWIRQWGPWFVGLAILVVIGTQVPFAQFKASIGHGPHITLALVEIAITFLVLCTDSVSTWIGMIALKIRWPFKKVVAVRGATYLLFLVNYALGQGGFGYYLYRAGEPALRAVGATLFLIGTNLATLLLLTFGVWALAGAQSTNPAMWWTLVIGTIAFGVYLVIIATRIGFLARRQVLAPLFDAHLKGHALAIVGRIPHVVAVVLAHWVAMRVWGIEVPFLVAATVMPAVALAAVLPISPAGLGTTQVAMVYFFRDYASGATADDRAASLLAFGIVHFVYGVLAALVVGLVCLPLAKKMGAVSADDDGKMA
jgi:hypothetical protein